MKPPQIIALLLLVAGLGYVALNRSGEPTKPAGETVTEEIPEPSAQSEPEIPAKKRPIFSGPHDGTHVFQGVRCPACELGPMEF